MKKEQIAAYIRLSKEDDKYKEESNSIMTQRMLLKKFVAENFYDYNLLEFCDDGYTGTNFERPGIQNMLELVRDSKIDCIVVKDFSRFARDYIELGSYLEQIFPFLGVRFISINDNYDSKNYQGSIADIDINFKNLLYDLYSKDLSQKVRSAVAIRKEQGQYLFTVSPFGYRKNPNDRHGLLIAEDEAEIVRRIYALTEEGYSSVRIAKLFNETGVKTPIEYKIEKEKLNKSPKGEKFLWSAATIRQILKNQVYIGNVVQKKFSSDTVGGKHHLNPKEGWLVTYNHHEPIIEKEVFEKIQQHRGKKATPQYRPSHPLVGKAVCGCCKKNLQHRKRKNHYFSCEERYSNVMENCVEKVNGVFLEEYVLFKMQEKLQADGELRKLRMEAVTELEKEIKEQKEKRGIQEKSIHKLKHENVEAYQNYVLGKTDSFQSNDGKIKAAEKELSDMNIIIRELEKSYIEMKNEQDCVSVESEFAVLSKEMLDRYIEKIIIYNEQNIEICWK